MVPDVKALREAMGWTQKELADAIGCTDTHISHLENGRAVGSVSLYQSMAEVCGVELMAYFTDPE